MRLSEGSLYRNSIRANIWKMYALSFLLHLQFFGAVTVLFFLKWIGIDYTQIFILEAFYALSIALLEIPTGVIADKYGRKISILFGCITSAIGMLIYGTTRNYYVLFLAEFVFAVGFTLISGADKALMYDSLRSFNAQDKARRYFARYDGLATAGLIVAFITGSYIPNLPWFHYPNSLAMTMIFAGGAMLFAAIITLTIHEPERRYKVNKGFIKEGYSGFRQIFINKKLRRFAFNFSLVSATTFFMFWFYQSLALSYNIGVSYYGYLATAFNIFGLLLLWNIKRLEQLFSVNNLLFYSAFIPGVCYICIVFTRNIYLAFALVMLLLGLKLMRQPLLNDYMNRHISSRNRATVLSGVSMLEKIVIMVMYPLVGLLADYSLSITLFILGLITIIFSLLTKVETSEDSYANSRR